MTKAKKIEWLKTYTNVKREEKIIFNDDNSLDILQSCFISVDLNNKELPFKFNIIHGDFDCSDIGLISFKNFPNEIKGSFYATNNCFKSTKEIPLKVNGEYIIVSKQNDIDLDFLRKLECSDKTEVVLKFQSLLITNDFLDNKFNWILESLGKKLSYDTYLSFNDLNEIKNLMNQDDIESNRYLNDFFNSLENHNI